MAATCRTAGLDSRQPPLPMTQPSQARAAQAARTLVEAALDATGWRWSRRLSLWIDVLIQVEESA